MPQNKSVQKRVRQAERRRARNRTYMSRLRTLIKRVESSTDRDQAVTLLNETKSYLDRLAGKGVIKSKKAANTKSKLERKVNAL